MFTWSIFFLLLKMTNSVFCGLNLTNHVSAHVFYIFISEFYFLYGLSESLVKWFQDYISNRKQIVFINNSVSRIGLLKAGVPQGSVLVPLLF
jgi:hypothetical protein